MFSFLILREMYIFSAKSYAKLNSSVCDRRWVLSGPLSRLTSRAFISTVKIISKSAHLQLQFRFTSLSVLVCLCWSKVFDRLWDWAASYTDASLYEIPWSLSSRPPLGSSSIVTPEFWVSEDVRLIWSTASDVNCPGFRHYGCPGASGLSTLWNLWRYKRRIQKCQEILVGFLSVRRVRSYFELREVWNVQQV